MLEVSRLSVRYGALAVVDDVSFSVDSGQWLMIIGPNGAGKSTIINAVSQGAAYTGRVLLDGKDVRHMKPYALARRMGVLAQTHFVGYAFTVEEVVRLGRYSYAPGIFSGQHDTDERAVAEAIRLTGLEPMLRQSVLTLSGGELQRTFLAQLLAQDPDMLILDEPSNHLDLVYQRQVFELVKEWLHGKDNGHAAGRAVVSVVHDLSLARAYGTHALLMNRGKAFAQGKIADVICPENLNGVYSMDVYDWMRTMLSQWNDSVTHEGS